MKNGVLVVEEGVVAVFGDVDALPVRLLNVHQVGKSGRVHLRPSPGTAWRLVGVGAFNGVVGDVRSPHADHRAVEVVGERAARAPVLVEAEEILQPAAVCSAVGFHDSRHQNAVEGGLDGGARVEIFRRTQ